jgi:hypothetical protein
LKSTIMPSTPRHPPFIIFSLSPMGALGGGVQIRRELKRGSSRSPQLPTAGGWILETCGEYNTVVCMCEQYLHFLLVNYSYVFQRYSIPVCQSVESAGFKTALFKLWCSVRGT